MSSDFGDDGPGPDPIFNDQVPEDSWYSISQRMAISQNTKTFERIPETLQLHHNISTAALVENNVSDPNFKVLPGLIEVNEKEIRSEVRRTRSKISETIVNRNQDETHRTIPTLIQTPETPMKRADPSDKRMNSAHPAVTPSQLLIDCGFEIDLNPSELPKALKWAARAGHVDVVRFLLARKPQITRQNGYQDLMGAVVISGKDEILRLMMENNVDMNLAGDDGWAALFFATIHGHESMVKMLLSPSSGAIINQKDSRGRTALHYAAKMKDDQITKMLIQSGADVNGLDDEGVSPLHRAATMGRKVNARLLLNANANANIEAIDEEGITPLRRAFENGHDDVVRLLLNRGANTGSAYVGPFAPRYAHTSKEGFEAA
jgi:ankyrin repeat protein